eukprot:scaffold122836_cov56-Cyclotella_meneghiniana.AAC.5
MEQSESSDGFDDPSLSINRPQYNYEYIKSDDIVQRSNHHINVERVQQIEESMTGVWNVINKYGNASLPSLDPNDIDANGWKIDDDSPWTDVSAAIKEIVSAREDMKRVLDHEQKFGSKKKKVNDLELDPTQHSFVVSKKQNSTTDNINSMSEEVDVHVLAGMMQSGGRLFSNVEKKMLLRARQRGNLPRNENLKPLPIHEMRKRASRGTK